MDISDPTLHTRLGFVYKEYWNLFSFRQNKFLAVSDETNDVLDF